LTSPRRLDPRRGDAVLTELIMTGASISDGQQDHGGAGRWVASLTLLAIILVSFIAQGVGWGGPIFGLPARSQIPPFAATAAQALMLAVPLAALAFTWSAPRYRAMFRAWLAAALILLALSPARLFPPVEGQAAFFVQAAILVAALVALKLAAPLPWGETPLLGAALGLLASLPWIIVGSLGSPLDIVLALALGSVLGLVAAHVVARFWLVPLEITYRSPGRDFFTGGLVIGGALLILSSGVGVNGLQLPLMIGLPALGWGAMAVAALGRARASAANWPGLALLVGAAAAVCLAFTDVDGMSILAQDAILGATLGASLAVAGMGWLIGLFASLLRGPSARARPGPPWIAAPAIALALALLLYATGGQTGLHGDAVFVVLEDQADASPAAGMADYDARRRYVYETLVAHADRTQAPLRAALDRLGVDYTPYYLVNALEVRGGWPIRLWLSTRADVARVMPAPVLRPTQSPLAQTSGSLDAPTEPQWNLTGIGATRAWAELGVTGEGIVIGQSDSGVQADHPEFAAAYRGVDSGPDYNWFDAMNGAPAPVDYGGHGTHTLGSILGKTVGVAPGATWFACANLPRNLGNPGLYLSCMQFMLAPWPQGGDPFRDGDPLRSAQVLNNSWGCPQDYEGCDAGSLGSAVDALRAAGIFVVASAGNDGPACSTLTDPIAIYDAAFTVGAVDEDGDLAGFSSRGPVTADGSGRPKPDIVAPGVDVWSAYPGGTYEVNSGTSMAGPHVAGVVALIWSANPALIGDIDRTEQILIETARPFTGEAGPVCGDPALGAPDNRTGHGIVDAYAAVKRAQQLR
jgi:subtilisin family serine protease